MKKYILVFLLIVFFGCKEETTKPNYNKSDTIEDHVSRPYFFPPGIYYSYNFPDNTPEDFDPSNLIEQVKHSDVTLRDVWYKGGNRMCVPPGSNIGMDVIVEPAMVIRVDKENLSLIILGFVKTSTPGMGSCSYWVLHYKYQ